MNVAEGSVTSILFVAANFFARMQVIHVRSLQWQADGKYLPVSMSTVMTGQTCGVKWS